MTLNTVFDNSSEYVLVTNDEGVIFDCNKMAKQRFNIIQGQTRLFEHFNIDREWLQCENSELVLEDINNKRIIVEVTYSKVIIENQSHFVFIFKDITSRKEDEINLKYLAETHYITHLPNRNQLQSLIEEKCQSMSDDCRLSFVFISFFDNNKVVEFYGHDRLEYLLLNIAMMLVEMTADNGSAVIHWGDNDFLMIEESSKAELLVEEIIKSFDKPIIFNENSDVGVYSRPTIGLCTSDCISHLGEYDHDDLVQQALLATFNGARDERRVTRYDDKLNQKIKYKGMIAEEIGKALQNKGFKVAYQPKIDLANGDVIGAEALIRWPHQTMGMISPDVFIPVAEQVGLIHDIGQTVLTQVFDDVAALKVKYPTIKHVAVNVSAPQLDEQFITLLQQLIESHDPGSSQFIELEITESSFLDDFKRVNVLFKEIKAMGFRLAIDDFGTGYSSLSYLHELPMDTLKIDRSFVLPILESQRSLQMVKSIVSMSQALGLDIVAEGIENAQTGQLLASLGVHQGQGFYYYRPEFL